MQAEPQPPQTHGAGGRRVLDARWLDYLGRNGRPEDIGPADGGLAVGVKLFNTGTFYESHECWERVWLATPYPSRLFYLALIKLATGFEHAARGNAKGARRLLRDGLRILAPFTLAFHGLDTARLAADTESWLGRYDGTAVPHFPRIHRVA